MAQTPTPQLTFEVSVPEREPFRVTLHKAQNLVGRDTGDIALGDPESSAVHAEIDITAGTVIVRDLGSSNGTWRDGERLPQFALFEGQSFFCGNSELELVEIVGIDDSIRPGQTAIGLTKLQTEELAHDTIVGSPSARPIQPPPGWSPPSPVSLGQPAPVARTTHAAPRVEAMPSRTSTSPLPSSSPTAPGEEQITAGAAGSSSVTVPGPAGASSTTPSSKTLPVGGTAPPVRSGATQVPATPEPAAHEPEPAAPKPAPAADPLYKPPVANAVIKPGGAGPAPETDAPRSSRAPRRWGRLLAIGGATAVGVAALAGLAYLVYTMLASRALAFGTEVAEDLPASTIGVVALRSVDDAVDLLDSEALGGPLERIRVDAVGFDPFDTQAWSSQGVRTSAPVGIALLDPTAPVFAASFGVEDRDAFSEAVRQHLPHLLGTSAGATDWTDRTFGQTEGEWSEDSGIAVLYRNGRGIVIFAPRSGWSEDVEEHATGVGGVLADESLASTEAFGRLQPPPGETILLGYLDGTALRDAMATNPTTLAPRSALADVDGLALLLSHDDDAIHLTQQMIVREGSRYLEVVDGAHRDGKALSRLEGPVLAAYDLKLDGPALDRALGDVASALGTSLAVVETAVDSQLGVDLRVDVTQNLSGGMGAALLGLPADPDRWRDVEAAAWLGVVDGDKATSTLARAYDAGLSRLGDVEVTQREVAGVQVYAVDADEQRDRPAFQLFVHEGYVWLLVGELDPSTVVEGRGAFPDGARHPSIGEVMAEGDLAAGFVDLAAGAPALLEFDDATPLLDQFETATSRTEHEGQVTVTRTTLHTKTGVGLRGTIDSLIQLAGEQLSGELARASRASRCAELSAHVVALSKAELQDKGAPLEAAWKVERLVQETCSKPTTPTARIDCYLEIDSIAGLTQCDQAHPDLPSPEPKARTSVAEPTEPEREPKAVPYVDDIWPHRLDDPDSDTPQPDVNYAVPLGEDPSARGPTRALVTIVMFGDFECEHCRAVLGTIDEVLAKHGEDVRLVFRHLPLDNVHPAARPAANAALAAHEQDEFWAMHDALYERGNRLDADAIEEAARAAGLDMEAYAEDLASADVDRRLQRDIDVAARFGVKGTPAFFINGRYLGGRQSASAFNRVIAEELQRAESFVQRRGDTRKRLYEDMLTHFADEVIQPEKAVEIPSLDAERYTLATEGLPKKGESSFAQVEIIECGDFDCPFCARSRKALEETLDSFSSVTLYFAHKPGDYHPGAEPAARAAQAAHAQGKFWEMHDALFEDQRGKARTDEDYERYAARLGLDVEKFVEDFASEETREAVAAQQKLCTDNDATVTPTFFINGRRVTGAQSAEQFEALVESELAGGI